MDLDKVSKYFGGDKAMSQKLRVTQGAISQWRAGGIPKMREYQIQVLTRGKFKPRKAS